MRYWHGGAPGRQPGDLLLSGEQVGVDTTHAALLFGVDEAATLHHRNRVYITVDENYAAFHAAHWNRPSPSGMPVFGGGTVYEVDPAGSLEPDPDDLPGQSFTVARARVVAVTRTAVYMSPLEANRARRAHSAYDDGSAMYSPEGWHLCARNVFDRPGMLRKLDAANQQLLAEENAYRAQHGIRPAAAPPTARQLLRRRAPRR